MSIKLFKYMNGNGNKIRIPKSWILLAVFIISVIGAGAWVYTTPPNGLTNQTGSFFGNTSNDANNYTSDRINIMNYLGVVVGTYLDSYSCDGTYCIYIPWYDSGNVYAKNTTTGEIVFKNSDAGAITQSVHDAILPNGTIYYRSGDYYFITKPIITKDKLNIKGESYRTTFHLGTGNADDTIEFLNADQFTISDIMFWGGNAGKAQLNIVGGSQYTLSNLQFYNFYGYGLDIDSSTHFILSNLYSDSSNSTGIAVGSIGVYIHGTPSSKIIEAQMDGYITERVQSGLKVSDFERSIFSRITATHVTKSINSSRAIYLINGTNSSFNDIITSDWLLNGIDITAVNDSTFSDVQSRNNTNHGMLLTSSDNNTIQGTFRNAPSGFAGIRLIDSRYNKIYNSQIKDNSVGIKESGIANNNTFELNTINGITPYTITGSGTMVLELNQSKSALQFYNSSSGWRII